MFDGGGSEGGRGKGVGGATLRRGWVDVPTTLWWGLKGSTSMVSLYVLKPLMVTWRTYLWVRKGRAARGGSEGGVQGVPVCALREVGVGTNVRWLETE